MEGSERGRISKQKNRAKNAHRIEHKIFFSFAFRFPFCVSVLLKGSLANSEDYEFPLLGIRVLQTPCFSLTPTLLRIYKLRKSMPCPLMKKQACFL